MNLNRLYSFVPDYSALMKNGLVTISLLASLYLPLEQGSAQAVHKNPQPVQNLIIITTDGFRWQEVFSGADPDLLTDPAYSPDAETMGYLYGGTTPEERRKKLMPFFWNVIAAKGQLYGNRNLSNKVNTANLYSISYPGYNELFTGHTDMAISSNKKSINPNQNVLEYLDQRPDFHGKVAAFTSWDVFPYIFNRDRNELPLNSGYESLSMVTQTSAVINKVQDSLITDREGIRYDRLTFLAAKEYLANYQPRVLYIGLGETDEFAHKKRYDLYLQQANEVDRMIVELWHWVQSTPGYRDNTTILITTDHGRGKKDRNWSKHGVLIGGSSQTWMAMLGPNIEPMGEMSGEQQLWQKQVAQTIATLLGENFDIAGRPIAENIQLPEGTN